MYTWTDANGVRHYSQTPPPKGTATERDIKTRDGNRSAPMAADASKPPSANDQACDQARVNAQTLATAMPVTSDKDGDGKAELLTSPSATRPPPPPRHRSTCTAARADARPAWTCRHRPPSGGRLLLRPRSRRGGAGGRGRPGTMTAFRPHKPIAPMRLSQFHLRTAKETPADAEVVSHQLMLRAGMIRKLAAGLYTWTPLGLRVLRKVETVVREEMNRAGAIEMLMPSIQPTRAVGRDRPLGRSSAASC